MHGTNSLVFGGTPHLSPSTQKIYMFQDTIGVLLGLWMFPVFTTAHVHSCCYLCIPLFYLPAAICAFWAGTPEIANRLSLETTIWLPLPFHPHPFPTHCHCVIPLCDTSCAVFVCLLCCVVIEYPSNLHSILVCMYVPMLLQKPWLFEFLLRELVAL